VANAYEFQWVAFSIRFPDDDSDLPEPRDLQVHAECLEGMTRNGWEHAETLFSEAPTLTVNRQWTLLTLLRRPLPAHCEEGTPNLPLSASPRE
jgi:hypothetical protein